MTAVKSLLVSVAGQVYVLPLNSVRETLDRVKVDCEEAGNASVLKFRDQAIPLYHLHGFFSGIALDDYEASYLVVLHGDQREMGRLVDAWVKKTA